MLCLSELARDLVESSLDDSDNEENAFLLMITKPYITPHVRCQNYVEDIVSVYTEKEFQMLFR